MSLALIRSDGDLLERHMFADANFAKWFGHYADAWASYVLPHRGNDGLDKRGLDWREFAQRHYTAIVRCWNVWEFQKRLESPPSDPAGQLRLHADFAGFFAMARAAIENLHKAQVAIAIRANSYEYLDERYGKDFPNIGWLRLPRHALLHNRVLPINSLTDPITIDISLLPACSNRTPDDMSWHKGDRNFRSLVGVIDEAWEAFRLQMNDLWRDLLQQLSSSSRVNAISGTGAGTASANPLAGTGSGVPLPDTGP